MGIVWISVLRRLRSHRGHRRARLAGHGLALLPRADGSQGRALDKIAARQRAADEKRREQAERQQQAAVVSQSAVVQ